jgi:hypothetical protein
MSSTVIQRVLMGSSDSADFLEQQHLRTISILQDGLQPGQIARRFGIDRVSVRRWKRPS